MKDLITKTGLTRLEHMTLMGKMEGGYLSRLVPAKSAPEYEHHLHKKLTIRGMNSFDMIYFLLRTQINRI